MAICNDPELLLKITQIPAEEFYNIIPRQSMMERFEQEIRNECYAEWVSECESVELYDRKHRFTGLGLAGGDGTVIVLSKYLSPVWTWVT